MGQQSQYKIKTVGAASGGAFAQYRNLVYGNQSLPRLIWAELVTLLFSNMPGALGLFVRSKLYRSFFREVRGKVVFGRGVTLRHTHKISLGAGVIIDDGALLDAKGDGNEGVSIGDGVYIGRNSAVYCKGGNIVLQDKVNLSANCQVFSSNELTIGAGTMVGAFSYFLSGGEYDYADPTPFAQQSGMNTKGPLHIGADCWFGARVTVLDGANVGDRCVLAAGTVVHKPVPSQSLAGGVPARILRENIGPVKPEQDEHV